MVKSFQRTGRARPDGRDGLTGAALAQLAALPAPSEELTRLADLLDSLLRETAAAAPPGAVSVAKTLAARRKR